MRVTSIILAGGKSRRFGRDKLAAMWDGKILLERVIYRVSSISPQIILSIALGQSLPSLSFPLRVTEVVDIYPNRGALGGIYSGLMASESLYNLVVASDMPCLNISLLQYMLQLRDNYDAVIPRVEGRAEPLHAIYSRSCLEPIRELLDCNILRISGFFDKVRVRWVEEDEINRFDPEHLSFLNINTPADLERAKLLTGLA